MCLLYLRSLWNAKPALGIYQTCNNDYTKINVITKTQYGVLPTLCLRVQVLCVYVHSYVIDQPHHGPGT